MNNGLDISEGHFMKLNVKERDVIIFRNLIRIRKQLKDYNLHKKINYIWLFLLTIFVGIKKFIGF